MSLPARTGWQWLKDGFGLFRTQPGVLTMFLFTNLMASLLLSTIPVAGPLVAMVLIPSFSMALMQACYEIDAGRRVGFGVLMTGFRMPGLVALCKVGLIYLAVSVLLTILMRSIIGENFFQQMATPIDPKNPPMLAASDVGGMALIFVLQAIALMALCFAAPLAYWQKMTPGKATFYSVFAVLGAKKAFATMVLSWFGIFFVVAMLVRTIFGNASVGQVVLVWIVMLFVLLLQCGLYAAYRQIFGMPEKA